jgi:hypothetical protein
VTRKIWVEESRRKGVTDATRQDRGRKGEGRVEKKIKNSRQPARMVSAISLLMVTFEAPSAAPRMYAFLSFSHLTMFAVC